MSRQTLDLKYQRGRKILAWFSASLIFFVGTEQTGPFTIYENVIIIDALSTAEAKILAHQFGKLEDIDDQSLRIGGEKAVSKYLGVRKIIQVTNIHDFDPENSKLSSGAEVSYSRFNLKNRKDLQKIVDGQSVWVEYID